MPETLVLGSSLMTLAAHSVWEYVLPFSLYLLMLASDVVFLVAYKEKRTNPQVIKAIGGTIWHGIKGFRNSPYNERLIGSVTAVKARAPVLGGNFGIFGGLLSLFDCTVKGIRRREDAFNAIGAGFLTGGCLAARGGFRAMRNNAIGCAIFIAVMEGAGIGFQRVMVGSTRLEAPPLANQDAGGATVIT